MVIMGTPVLGLIDRVGVSLGQRPAVRAHDGTLSYAQLSARADALAQRLQHLTVRRGDLVGLCLPRSASLVVAALGIVKAGAAYVAIDPTYPQERVRWMLEDSGAVAVVTDPAGAHQLDGRGRWPVVVMTGGGELAASDAELPTRGEPLLSASIGPDDLAYVVYTSGSTGLPKGVLVEHASLSNLVHWHCAAFELGPGDRCTQIASPGFDAAVWEIWPSLAAGAVINVVADELRNDPVRLRDWLVAEQITVSFLPTAVAEAIIALPWPEDAALRYLLTGGDALTRRPRPDLGFTLINNYGLSETAVVATSGPVAPSGEGIPSIGRPISGVSAEVVDQQLTAVAAGEEGELVVSGAAVSRGYLNRPELTAQRFLNGDGRRRYRTGDRVRLRADGEIEFLGRLDDQLSIRGFRVEPGEVVAALNSHPAIEASAAVGIGNSSADRRLVAYAVPAGSDRPARQQLDEFLGSSLPDYLVPSDYVWLEQLPVTAHGKIDRAALPMQPQTAAAAPPASNGASDSAGFTGTGDIPATVAAMVSELLEVDEVGLHQNFFLLGGHSMLGAQLIVRLEDLFGVEVSLRYLFDHPTPAEIAAEVQRQVETDHPSSGVSG
jgi:amino acid adenylation domain-containing protein